MPRKPFIAQCRYPYHITNRCNNKDWFEVPLPIVWRIFSEQLSDSTDRFSVRVHNFVLMSNHFHMIVSTPNENLDRFLRHLLTEVCRRLQGESGRINHIFGGRSKQTVLDSAYAVAYVFKYVYRNPVRAGVVNEIEEYRYSTWWHLIRGSCGIPIVEGIDSPWSLVPRNLNERLDWCNLPTAKEQEALIGKALRRSRFQFSRSNSLRKEMLLLYRSYGIIHDDPYLLSPKGECLDLQI